MFAMRSSDLLFIVDSGCLEERSGTLLVGSAHCAGQWGVSAEGAEAHDPVQPGSTEGRPMDGAVSSPSRVARPESCGPRPLAKRLCIRVHIGVRDQWAAT